MLFLFHTSHRQANWKLDPPLRKECKLSVEGLCSQEEKKGSEDVRWGGGAVGRLSEPRGSIRYLMAALFCGFAPTSLSSLLAATQGFVYKCLIREYDQLSAGCQKELGRAVHMAFFAWQPDGIITR